MIDINWRERIEEFDGLKHLYIYDNLESAIDMDEPNVSYYIDEDIVKYNIHAHDYSLDYLTFEALQDTTFTFTKNALQYSLDNGSTWATLAAGTTSPTVIAGNKILWKQTGLTATRQEGIGTFSSTGQFNAQGNIMSLHYGDNFKDQISLSGKNYAFVKLFSNNKNICNCENLILPANTLSNEVYMQMFIDCSNLINGPKILPATILADSCYYMMFKGCSSLITAPILPATTLVDYCYSYMFYGCTNLTESPILAAKTLTTQCYRTMFAFCSNLNKITCLATDISASYCVSRWHDSCSSTGTFVKAASMTSWPTGNNGIPTGWTIIDNS